MKVLVVGGGGREHALVWKIRQSPRVEKVYCAPGNAGIAHDAECVDIAAADVVSLAEFAERESIELTVVGPELPLTLGLSDEFHLRGLRVLGPRKAAAELEGSKVFAKEFMRRWQIPTAEYHVCDSAEEALHRLAAPEMRFPLVVKADGLAAGKGVIIAEDRAAAEDAVRGMMVDRKFGTAGARVVLEEFLTGREVSIIVLVDGKRFLPMVTSQDYKRAEDGDQGPNTGGMGCYSPSVYLDRPTFETIQTRVLGPVVDGLVEDGREYRGFLYAGLMLTADGPKVLEFNVRLGDPETQVILPRLRSDLVDVMVAAADGDLSQHRMQWHPGACVCVVGASGGYPGSYPKGLPISGLDAADALEGVTVFHAGTRAGDDGAVLTAGGRVLGITAVGADLAEARERAYRAVDAIEFDGLQVRRDIAEDAVARLRSGSDDG